MYLSSHRAHDNSRLASGGADKAVILTDVGTGQHIRTFRGHMSVSVVVTGRMFVIEAVSSAQQPQHANHNFFKKVKGQKI